MLHMKLIIELLNIHMTPDRLGYGLRKPHGVDADDTTFSTTFLLGSCLHDLRFCELLRTFAIDAGSKQAIAYVNSECVFGRTGTYRAFEELRHIICQPRMKLSS